MITIPPCPSCGHEGVAAAQGQDPDREPQSGDLTLCGGCLRWCLFSIDDAGKMSLRKPTDAEAVEFVTSPLLASILRTYRAARDG